MHQCGSGNLQVTHHYYCLQVQILIKSGSSTSVSFSGGDGYEHKDYSVGNIHRNAHMFGHMDQSLERQFLVEKV